MLVPLVLSRLCAETPSCAFQLLLPETPWRDVAGKLNSPSNTASNQACFLFLLQQSEECKAHASTLANTAASNQACFLVLLQQSEEYKACASTLANTAWYPQAEVL